MTSKNIKISVLGDGGWGTALALLLVEKKFSVTLWGAFSGYVEEMRKSRENSKFLPGFKLPANLNLTADLKSACESSELIVLASPSQYLRPVLKQIKNLKLKNKIFVSVAKGVETESLKTMSRVIREELGPVKVCVISGPCIAKEVAQKLPAAVSCASTDKKTALMVRQIFSTDYFGVFTSDDVLGVELGGSIKNVIAICAGILEGLGFGSNTRALLFARGVAEMARLGVKMGAKRETFMGLSGLGDLATTCLSPISRNRSLGEAIGKGGKLNDILNKTEMVVEGVDTAKGAFKLAKKYKVKMPIVEAVYGILFKEHDPQNAVKALLNQELHSELD